MNAVDSIKPLQNTRRKPMSQQMGTTNALPEERFWNRYAKRYGAVENLYPHQQMLRDTINLIPASAESVLDVGCGSGVLLQKLNQANPSQSLHGIDFSEAMLKIASERVPTAELRQGDFNSALPFDNETFECVVSTNALYTVNSPERLVGELLRITKPGGIIVISSPKQQAKGVTILLDHWKNTGLLSGFLDLLKFAPCMFYNVLIEHHAREQRYHFLTEEAVKSLADCPVQIHDNTFAGQNWLFTIKRTDTSA